MNLNDLISDIHANSIAHGWWDTPRSDAEVRALIHSELSEALEEDRAGNPAVWYMCKQDGERCRQCEEYKGGRCEDIYPKPEGWAIELIDACIRIMDHLGFKQYPFKLEKTIGEMSKAFSSKDLSTLSLGSLIDVLHANISMAYTNPKLEFVAYRETLTTIFSWLAVQGFDPEELLLEKHRYNKTRPYKHGKRY